MKSSFVYLFLFTAIFVVLQGCGNKNIEKSKAVNIPADIIVDNVDIQLGDDLSKDIIVSESTKEDTSLLNKSEPSTMKKGKLTDGNYVIQSSESTVAWFGSKIGGSHEGTILIEDGGLNVENGFIVSGSFILDMSTITSPDGDGLVNHLKSKDFFDIEKFPKSKFVIKSVTSVDENNFTVTGDLTIRDITRKISFPARITTDKTKLGSEATFTIDRTLWGIEFRSGKIFKDIGDKLIHDDIKFTLDLNSIVK